MPDPVAVIRSLGGIATRQQLIARGSRGYDLTLAVRTGRIRRVRQARYATADADFDAVAAARVGGLLAGPSAARSYGLWSGYDTRLHVSVGDNSSRLRTNVAPSFRSGDRLLTPDTSQRAIVLHWLEGGAVPELGPECWRVPLKTCLRQMVAWCDCETAIACLDTALTVRRLSRAEIFRIFADEPASARLVAAECRHGSDSGIESIVRQRLAALDIGVRQQVPIPGVGRIDLQILGTRVLLEINGREFHDNPEAFEHDHRRYAELTARGYTVLTLSYLQITADWPWCERMIRQAIGRLPSFRS